MIDLHCHILPEIDDGARSLDVSLAMARAFVDQGVTHVACTPHILPGIYHNTGPQIREAITALQGHLDEAGIPLRLTTGADNHVVPDFVAGLRSGHLLSLGDTRYVLVEPPHNIAPNRLDELVFGILLANYVPIITHPERLKWIEGKYDLMRQMAARGVWMQITSGSLIGRFGGRCKYWADRMVCEGLVQILATDAHNTTGRPPDLDKGRMAAEGLVGAREADLMVSGRPSDILANKGPHEVAPIVIERQAQSEREGRRHVAHAASRNSDGLLGRLRHLLGG